MLSRIFDFIYSIFNVEVILFAALKTKKVGQRIGKNEPKTTNSQPKPYIRPKMLLNNFLIFIVFPCVVELDRLFE